MRFCFLILAVFLCFVGDLSGKAIQASSRSDERFRELYAADGNMRGRWISKPISGNKPEWIQFDFLKPVPVNNLKIAWGATHGVEYKVEISNDRKAWTTLAHVIDGKADEVREFKDLGGKGRYLRILCIKPGGYQSFA